MRAVFFVCLFVFFCFNFSAFISVDPLKMANKVELKTVKALNPGVISKVARLSLIVRVNLVLNRTVVVDSD